ncbi:MAG: sensor histidine kinase [Porticoccaceae bacterium]
MNETNYSKPIDRLYRDNDTQFLVLQFIGWFSLSIITYFSLTLWYNQLSLDYIAHPLIQSLMGIIVSWPLRPIFHRIWNKDLITRLFLALFAVLLCSVIWSVMRMTVFMWMTGETGLWNDFGGWLFASIMIFLCWAAFYHGIKYYQLLQSEHATLLTIEAENKEAQLKRSKAETIAQEAQLKMLRYQLNPHFLFNTLNAIASLVEGKHSANANTMIVQLSNFLRYSLENDPIRRVTLAQELDALRLYLNIEQTRFGERLMLNYDIDPAATEVKVPSLLLQPLVENSIKYAIAPMEKGGEISILAKLDGDYLIVEVSDSGLGVLMSKNDKAAGVGIGLKNTIDRLDTFYGDQYVFQLGNSELGGLRIFIRLPLEKQSAESRAEQNLSENNVNQ